MINRWKTRESAVQSVIISVTRKSLLYPHTKKKSIIIKIRCEGL